MSNRKEQLEVLEQIIPMVRETFEKRKRVERLNKQISSYKQQLQSERKEQLALLLENSIQSEKANSILNSMYKPRMQEIQLEISKREKIIEKLKKEIFIEELTYKGPGEFLKGIRLTEDEAKKDTILLLYFMNTSRVPENYPEQMGHWKLIS